MTIKMLGTMACNPQETAKAAAQLLPFSYIFRNGDCALRRSQFCHANLLDKAAKKKKRKLSFSFPSRLCAFA
jgi:hypothetical protein